MAVNNSIAQNKPKPFSVQIQGDMYKNLINNTLQDPKRIARFTSSITSAVAVNPKLQECNAHTILSGALLGESLGLSPSPQLGQFYLVPFEKKINGRTVDVLAQFILGYKGYIQMAVKSGIYKQINFIAVKKGEFVSYNRFTEELVLNPSFNDADAEDAETVGYYGIIELHDGFKKTMYWSREKMERHADKYSKAFSLEKYRLLKEGKILQSEMWKYSSHWYTDFDRMALKTIVRQLLGTWGVLSDTMQEAYEKDTAVIYENGATEYVDMGSEYLGAYDGVESAAPAAAAPAPENEATVDAPVVDGDVISDFFS